MAADLTNVPGGVAAQHPPRRSLPVLVAPSLTGEQNAVAVTDAPLACWRLEAARFDFDLSVIRPDAEPELTLLAGMYDATGGAALSVFGHADPVGDDEYNKALSGRRAKAVYALLTHDTHMWNELANAEVWPAAAFTMMQERTGKPPGTARDELFGAYMDAICHRPDGSPFVVPRSGFLGRGLDPGGKADYQGCSEFNPILRSSAADEQALSAPERRAERNARNAPNRRVLVFLFPAGMFAPAASWPCPRAAEGSGGCRAQFWPDGDHRREAQDSERTYERDKDTFACAFYDRMARRSPCELLRKTLRIRLLDPDGRPISGARYQLTVGGHDVRTGTASVRATPPPQGGAPPPDDGSAGWLTEDHVLAPSECELAYAPADATESPDRYPFKLAFLLEFKDETDEAYRRRLHNLGYHPEDDRAVAVTRFQRDYGLAEHGQLDEPTKQRLRSAHDDGVPPSEVNKQDG
jgi:hypothetical protein